MRDFSQTKSNEAFGAKTVRAEFQHSIRSSDKKEYLNFDWRGFQSSIYGSMSHTKDDRETAARSSKLIPAMENSNGTETMKAARKANPDSKTPTTTARFGAVKVLT
jgi:hypothetical protein